MKQRSRADMRRVALFLVSTLSGCAVVSGGAVVASAKSRNVLEGEVPQVVVIYERKSQSLCSGSVFGQVYIVTSARCFAREDGVYDVYNSASIFTDGPGGIGATVKEPEHTIIDFRRANTGSPAGTLKGNTAGDGDLAVAIVDRPFPKEASYSLDLLDPQKQGLPSWPELSRIKADFVGYGQSAAHKDARGRLIDDGAGKKRIGTTLVLNYQKDQRVFSSAAQPSVGCLGDGGGPLLYNVMDESGSVVRYSFLLGVLYGRIGKSGGQAQVVSSGASSAQRAFAQPGNVQPGVARLGVPAEPRGRRPAVPIGARAKNAGLEAASSEEQAPAGEPGVAATKSPRVTDNDRLKQLAFDCDASGTGNEWTATAPYVQSFFLPQMRALANLHLENATEFWKDFVLDANMRRTLKKDPVIPRLKGQKSAAVSPENVSEPRLGTTAGDSKRTEVSRGASRPQPPWPLPDTDDEDGPNPLPPALERPVPPGQDNGLETDPLAPPPPTPPRRTAWRKSTEKPTKTDTATPAIPSTPPAATVRLPKPPQ